MRSGMWNPSPSVRRTTTVHSNIKQIESTIEKIKLYFYKVNNFLELTKLERIFSVICLSTKIRRQTISTMTVQTISNDDGSLI